MDAEYVHKPCWSEAELIETVHNVDGVITSPFDPPFTRGVIEGMTRCRVISNMGVGYDKIQELLTDGNPVFWSLLALACMKILATSTTLGSGGSGGVFSPSLYLGATLGAGLGAVLRNSLPGMTTMPAAYALVGMAAVFAATSHAPITSVLIVFELTADYRMILPLMVACGASVLTARAIYRFSIYNIKLVRRGVHVQLGQDVSLLNDIEIREAMTADVMTVPPDTPAREAVKLFEQTAHHGFPVVDEQGVLHGMVTAADIRRAAEKGRLDEPVARLATHQLVVAFPDETLNDALRKLGLHHVGRVPVVDHEDHRRLLGIITRKDIVAAYNRALLQAHTDLEKTAEKELFE